MDGPAAVAKLGKGGGLKSRCCESACGFESHPPHRVRGVRAQTRCERALALLASLGYNYSRDRSRRPASPEPLCARGRGGLEPGQAPTADAGPASLRRLRFPVPRRHGLSYAYLLGLYLGDGHISTAPARRLSATDLPRSRVSADRRECAAAIAISMPASKVRRSSGRARRSHGRRRAPIPVTGHASSRSTEPGLKHQRPIVLEAWQREILDRYPWRFLRGLIHSDGCSVDEHDQAPEEDLSRIPATSSSNRSEDIRGLFCEYCDKRRSRMAADEPLDHLGRAPRFGRAHGPATSAPSAERAPQAIIPAPWTRRAHGGDRASCARSRAGSPGPTPSAARRTGSPSDCAGSGGGSRSSRPTSTLSSALVHAAALPARVRRQPGRDLGRRRSASGSCCSPRPRCTSTSTTALYLLRAPVLSPRLAERRLPRPQPGRPRAADHLRPPRRRAHRRRLRAERRARRVARLGRALPVARPVPDPLLVAGAAAARCSARGWPGSTPNALSRAPAPPHPRPAGRHLRPGRDRALRRRPRRQRQRLRGRHRALARRGARRRRRPSNLDVWVVLDGGEECLQEGMRSFVRAPPQASSTASTTFFLALDSVGRGDVRFETAAGWVVSYGMDRRLIELCEAIAEADAETTSATAPRRSPTASAGDAMPPRLAGCARSAITCLDATATCPNCHLPTDVPDSDRPGRARPRPRLRARADPPARPRRRAAAPRVIEPGP